MQICTIGDYRCSDKYNSKILTDFYIKLNALSTEILFFQNSRNSLVKIAENPPLLQICTHIRLGVKIQNSLNSDGHRDGDKRNLAIVRISVRLYKASFVI